jgi:SRSO17 transposase
MVEAGRVEEKLGALIGRIGSYFCRVEPVRQVRKYIHGLMSDLPRKNCWTLAEYAGDRTPDRMQRLLERASWNTLAVMRVVRDFVVEHLADPHALAVLVLDESGQEKSGTPA